MTGCDSFEVSDQRETPNDTPFVSSQTAPTNHLVISNGLQAGEILGQTWSSAPLSRANPLPLRAYAPPAPLSTNSLCARSFPVLVRNDFAMIFSRCSGGVGDAFCLSSRFTIRS